MRPRESRAKIDTIESIPGSGRSRPNDPRTNPSTDALLPMPNAIVSSSASDRPGALAKLRAQYRRFANMVNTLN